ncbi:hypothetical protein RCL1_008167 [Eukaryota sp. TZLM3-RCL]
MALRLPSKVSLTLIFLCLTLFSSNAYTSLFYFYQQSLYFPALLCLLYLFSSIMSLIHLSLTLWRSRESLSSLLRVYASDLPSSSQKHYENLFSHCDSCSLTVPFRSFHCTSCNKCVGGYDHHSELLGCCVFYSNRRNYFMFNFYFFLTNLFYLVTIYFKFSNNFENLVPKFQNVPVFFTVVFAVFTLFWMFFRVIENFRLIIKNSTRYNQTVFENLRQTFPNLVDPFGSRSKAQNWHDFHGNSRTFGWLLNPFSRSNSYGIEISNIYDKILYLSEENADNFSIIEGPNQSFLFLNFDAITSSAQNLRSKLLKKPDPLIELQQALLNKDFGTAFRICEAHELIAQKEELMILEMIDQIERGVYHDLAELIEKTLSKVSLEVIAKFTLNFSNFGSFSVFKFFVQYLYDHLSSVEVDKIESLESKFVENPHDFISYINKIFTLSQIFKYLIVSDTFEPNQFRTLLDSDPTTVLSEISLTDDYEPLKIYTEYLLGSYSGSKIPSEILEHLILSFAPFISSTTYSLFFEILKFSPNFSDYLVNTVSKVEPEVANILLKNCPENFVNPQILSLQHEMNIYTQIFAPNFSIKFSEFQTLSGSKRLWHSLLEKSFRNLTIELKNSLASYQNICDIFPLLNELCSKNSKFFIEILNYIISIDLLKSKKFDYLIYNLIEKLFCTVTEINDRLLSSLIILLVNFSSENFTRELRTLIYSAQFLQSNLIKVKGSRFFSDPNHRSKLIESVFSKSSTPTQLLNLIENSSQSDSDWCNLAPNFLLSPFIKVVLQKGWTSFIISQSNFSEIFGRNFNFKSEIHQHIIPFLNELYSSTPINFDSSRFEILDLIDSDIMTYFGDCKILKSEHEFIVLVKNFQSYFCTISDPSTTLFDLRHIQSKFQSILIDTLLNHSKKSFDYSLAVKLIKPYLLIISPLDRLSFLNLLGSLFFEKLVLNIEIIKPAFVFFSNFRFEIEKFDQNIQICSLCNSVRFISFPPSQGLILESIVSCLLRYLTSNQIITCPSKISDENLESLFALVENYSKLYSIKFDFLPLFLKQLELLLCSKFHKNASIYRNSAEIKGQILKMLDEYLDQRFDESKFSENYFKEISTKRSSQIFTCNFEVLSFLFNDELEASKTENFVKIFISLFPNTFIQAKIFANLFSKLEKKLVCKLFTKFLSEYLDTVDLVTIEFSTIPTLAKHICNISENFSKFFQPEANILLNSLKNLLKILQEEQVFTSFTDFSSSFSTLLFNNLVQISTENLAVTLTDTALSTLSTKISSIIFIETWSRNGLSIDLPALVEKFIKKQSNIANFDQNFANYLLGFSENPEFKIIENYLDDILLGVQNTPIFQSFKSIISDFDPIDKLSSSEFWSKFSNQNSEFWTDFLGIMLDQDDSKMSVLVEFLGQIFNTQDSTFPPFDLNTDIFGLFLTFCRESDVMESFLTSLFENFAPIFEQQPTSFDPEIQSKIKNFVKISDWSFTFDPYIKYFNQFYSSLLKISSENLETQSNSFIDLIISISSKSKFSLQIFNDLIKTCPLESIRSNISVEIFVESLLKSTLDLAELIDDFEFDNRLSNLIVFPDIIDFLIDYTKSTVPSTIKKLRIFDYLSEKYPEKFDSQDVVMIDKLRLSQSLSTHPCRDLIENVDYSQWKSFDSDLFNQLNRQSKMLITSRDVVVVLTFLDELFENDVEFENLVESVKIFVSRLIEIIDWSNLTDVIDCLSSLTTFSTAQNFEFKHVISLSSFSIIPREFRALFLTIFNQILNSEILAFVPEDDDQSFQNFNQLFVKMFNNDVLSTRLYRNVFIENFVQNNQHIRTVRGLPVLLSGIVKTSRQRQSNLISFRLSTVNNITSLCE